MNKNNLNPIIENEHFIIYGNNDLDLIKEEVLNVLTKEKNKLLQFLNIDIFPKVTINLFNDYDAFVDYHKNIGYEITSYSKATFIGNTINKLYDSDDIKNRKYWLISGLIHEYFHILYQSIWQDNYERVVWIDEGLAQYKAGQFSLLQKDYKKFKSWYLYNIIRRDKEIPPIDYLTSHGDKYGMFCDNTTLKYNGYDLSYLLARYLIEQTKLDISALLTDKSKIDELSKTIMQDCINFYNSYFKTNEIKNNFYDISTPEELFDYMILNLIYGWIDVNNKEHINTLKDFRENYKTSSIDEILSTKLGTCIESAKLIKHFLDLKGIENKMFCYRSYKNEDNFDQEVKMHCFVLYNLNGYWYHFEHSNYDNRGIHKYDSLELALEQITKRHNENGIRELSEIDDIPDGLSFKEFNQFVNQFNNKIRGF